MKFDNEFWEILDKLVAECNIVIDRKKNQPHPKWPDYIYPLDYRYLDGTASMDQGGIDVWVGSADDKKVSAVICIVDYLKKDSEIKVLIGCTEEEMQLVYNTQNRFDNMRGILVKRN